jgi:glutathione S-transferase
LLRAAQQSNPPPLLYAHAAAQKNAATATPSDRSTMPTALPARAIVLYRHPLSGHCHRVELLLRMLELPFETNEIDFARGDHRRAEFRALNAFAQVPVIDDGGTIVCDSNAILVYLALRYAPPSWLPRDPHGAAQVQRWLSVAAGPLAYGAARARVAQLFALDRDCSEAIASAHALFATMERLLDEHGFLVGPEPTIADLALYSYTAHAPEGNVSLAGYPRLRGWLRRVEALPRFAPMAASRVGPAA